MTDFPDSPSFGQTFSAMGRAWEWNGTAWRAVSAFQNPDWADVINKPDTFPPATHSHGISEVTGLPTALDGKQAAGSYATAAQGALADTALQPSALTPYRTSAAQDVIDAGKQPAGSYAPANHTHAPSEVTGLLDGDKIASTLLPSYVDDIIEVALFAALPAGERGKIYVTLDTGKIYRWSGSDYVEIISSPGTTTDVPEGTNLYFTNARASAAAPVQSVAGRVGSVTLTKNDVGLGNVDNTADADKPVSTAQQTALNGKANTAHSHAIADVPGLETALNGKQAAGSYAPATGIAPSAITGTAVVDSDSRLNDSRQPTPHKSSHATGGTDALTPSDIGAASSTHSHAIADVTGLQAVLDIKSAATVFAKTALPLAGAAGSQTLVTDGSATSTPAMAYFYQGKWYRTLDNAMIADKVVDVYLLAGQSNAHGHAIVSSLTTAQKTQNGLFYSSWHDDTSNASSTQYYSDWATSLVAGSTRGDSGKSTLGGSLLFGPEIGFVNRANAISLADGRPIAILKHAIGASTLTDVGGSPDLSDWDLTATGDRKGDALRAFKLAIADALGKLTASGYTYRLAGFIWWQGESGGANASLIAFISHIRTYLATTYGLDMPTAQFPFVITGTTSYWGTTYQSQVANLDAYVGYVDSQKWSTPTGTETGNVHPGSGNDGFSTDADNDTQNDMFTIGQKYADQMLLAKNGATATNWEPVLADAKLWADASKLTGSVGAAVTSLTDRVAGNPVWNVIGSATIGTQNSRNVIAFSPTQDVDYLQSASAITTSTGRQIWYIVVRPESVNSNQDSIFAQVGGNAITVLPNSSTDFLGMLYHGGKALNTSNISSTNLEGTYSLFAFDFDPVADTVKTYLNGTLKETYNTQTQPATPFDLTMASSTAYRIMSQYGAPTATAISDGYFAEALITINTADHQKTEGYLAWKWGLQGKLPTGHPYKNAAP